MIQVDKTCTYIKMMVNGAGMYHVLGTGKVQTLDWTTGLNLFLV